MPADGPVRIGTAGWAVPRAVADHFPSEGSGLQRYAAVFNAVEINTTFYRPHKPETFRRWAESTPDSFRFAVKAPRTITHERRLRDVSDLLSNFMDQARELGDRLGPVLVQLPPTLAFDARTAEPFLTQLRSRHDGGVALEPRHATWFTAEVEGLLATYRVARVAADPARTSNAGQPAGWGGLVYHRLHGSPRMYYSEYDQPQLDRLAAELGRSGGDVWCVFDNTASGAAASDALKVKRRLDQER